MTIDLNTLNVFNIAGRLEELVPYGSGHLNRTFRGRWQNGASSSYYIHQIINANIFTDVPGLIHNIAAVTEHLHKRMAAAPAANRQMVLKLVPLKKSTNCLYYQDPAGNYWRTYEFIPNSISYDTCAGTAVAYECARSFGNFNRFLGDLDPAQLKITIAHFIDTRRRLRNLEEAVRNDIAGRVSEAKEELEFIRTRSAAAGIIMEALDCGRVPWRVTHNDLKLNNLLFDSEQLRGLCVVDLDTCMAGSWLYDFGDLVRTAASAGAEDERDLQKVYFRRDLFEALVEGFAETLCSSMTAGEAALLPLAPKIITLHMGMRFLTDYLCGDVYYAIKRPGHNLDRCRTQLKLAADMENQEKEISSAVQRSYGS